MFTTNDPSKYMKLSIFFALCSCSAAFTNQPLIGPPASLQSAFSTVLRAKKYVVVGGGWGGWGAAKALCEGDDDVDVILIDALPDPTGVSTFCYL